MPSISETAAARKKKLMESAPTKKAAPSKPKMSNDAAQIKNRIDTEKSEEGNVRRGKKY